MKDLGKKLSSIIELENKADIEEQFNKISSARARFSSEGPGWSWAGERQKKSLWR